MMAFDDFAPGVTLGRRDFVCADEAIDLWVGLFPDDRKSLPAMPPAMIAMVVMRAFIEICTIDRAATCTPVRNSGSRAYRTSMTA